MVVRGKGYPLVPRISVTAISTWQKDLEELGVARYWHGGEGRIWGAFVSFDKHNTRYAVTANGKPTRNRRKTPEPPNELYSNELDAYTPVFASFSQSSHSLSLSCSLNTKRTMVKSFDRFWQLYPRKVNKKTAKQVWLNKIKPDDELMQSIMDGLESQINTEQWTKGGGQFIPHPTTWLNGERWNDEVTSIDGKPEEKSKPTYVICHTENCKQPTEANCDGLCIKHYQERK